MKKFFSFFSVLIIVSSFSFSQSKNGKLIILHSNDLHSNLNGFSPEIEYTPCLLNDDNTVGGLSRIAAIIQSENLNYPGQVLTLDAGDFLMGTFFHLFEKEHGFQLGLMKKMGYDVVAIGNHEFDFGCNSLAKIINSTISNYSKIPQLTLANINFSQRSNDDDEFEELYSKGIIKPYTIIEKNGFRIGIFGLLGIDADEASPYKMPLKITNRIKKAKDIVKILRKNEKVDLVICLSHCGVAKNKKSGDWTGEDVELAKKVKGIDIIVSGHSHHEIFDPIIIGNTMILQTGSQGKYFGRLELNFMNGKISNAKYKLIHIDDNIYGDCKVHQEIASRIRMIDDELLKPMNLGYYRPLAKTDFELTCDENAELDSSNLGSFVADAIFYYINELSPEKTDISMVAAGVIRDKIKPGNKGILSAPDVFRVMSLGEGEDNIPGYPLAKVYLTSHEIKNIMELLLFAGNLKSSYYCFYSGILVEYDSSKGLFNKINKIYIGGKEIDFSKKNKTLYSISANTYMLDFLGNLKKMSFGLVKVIPKDQKGNPIKNYKETWIDFDNSKVGIQEGKEWIAIIKYLQSFPDTDSDKIPEIPTQYKEPIIRFIDINNKK